MKEFSVQHFTFRPLTYEMGLFPALAMLPEMGYTGVETCFFGGFETVGMSGKEFGVRLADLGLKMVGNHFTREMFKGSHDEAFAYIAEAGGKYAMYNCWNDYSKAEHPAEAADFLNSLVEPAKKAGITVVYHNHGAEFVEWDGKLILDRIVENLDPAVALELDVFFTHKQGVDACEYLKKRSDRIRLVHLKQMNAAGDNVDLPDGVIDMAKIVANAPNVTDFIVEQSQFAVSIVESLRRNAAFMKEL